MLKSLCSALILLLSALPVISYGQPHDFQKNGITYTWEKEPRYAESKKIFVDAFVHGYSRIPLDVLRQPSREAMVQWLEDAFDELQVEYQSSANKLWLSASANGQPVGFLVIDTFNHPEEIYLAQLAVDPAYHRRGIGSSLIRGLFDQFPDCGRFVLVTRRANEQAAALYNALGFVSSPYMHPEYSPELYTGFEYIRQQEAVGE